MIIARALARLVSFLLLFVLALVGLAVAVSCIGSGGGVLSLSWLADLAHLPDLRDALADWFRALEDDGPIAWQAALSGLGAMQLAAVLLVGVLVPRRERLVRLDDGSAGRLSARRRPLAQVARALVEQVRGVTEARAKVRSRRRGGGRLTVVAEHSRRAEPDALGQAATETLDELTGPFRLKARVRPQLGDTGSRVE